LTARAGRVGSGDPTKQRFPPWLPASSPDPVGSQGGKFGGLGMKDEAHKKIIAVPHQEEILVSLDHRGAIVIEQHSDHAGDLEVAQIFVELKNVRALVNALNALEGFEVVL
jgi:hypothetical protein